MEMSKGNLKHTANYSMKNQWIDKTNKEKDGGITIMDAIRKTYKQDQQ